MLTVQKILLPTDFSRCAEQALIHAMFLTQQHRVELHFYHVIDPYDDPNNPTHHFPTTEEMSKLVVEFATPDLASKLHADQLRTMKTRETQERGLSIASAILEYATKNDIDLIVMGTHGRRGLGHLLLGSVTEEIVRLSPCPVLTIREQQEKGSIKLVQRILVPVDFSGHARQALANARELADLYGAELQILHVIEEVMHPAFYVSGRTSIFEFMPQVEADSAKYIQQMLDEVVGKGYPAEIYLKEGHPAQEIVNFVEPHKTDLIVIATHGLTGIEHFLLGSVTEKVVRLAQCPVFTVKGFGKSLVTSLFHEQKEAVT